MTITPDPKSVREIAEEAMRNAIRDHMFWHVNQVVIERGVPGSASKGSMFEVHRSAAIAEYKRMADALSWPDEQPQGGDPCAVCYCRGCRQCVNPTPPSEVCFCMKAMRPEIAKVVGEQPQDERDARIAELESERDRYRIAWRMARQRAKVAGWAADKYAKRSHDLHEAAMDMLTENLGLKMFGPEAVAAADAEAAQAERDGDVRAARMPTCCDALPAGWVHGANCAALNARDTKAGS